MLIYTWRRRGKEVMFSWPISSPLAILPINLWLLGHFKDRNGNVALMNVMCDINQFVIVVPVPNETVVLLLNTSCNTCF